MLQERAAEALRSGSLQTYKQQISFGLHVIVMMGTFFAVGYIAGTALSPNLAVVGLLPLSNTAVLKTYLHSLSSIAHWGVNCKTFAKCLCAHDILVNRRLTGYRLLQRAACGLSGLVLAMLLETVLLMIETNRFEAPRRTPKPRGSKGAGVQQYKKQQ